ncbi:MAG: GNAT family N-acetyltransferase [Chlamydiia bacterium]|nr:GNAT family N-acetyltransferase [Chlamydiia bacterium]
MQFGLVRPRLEDAKFVYQLRSDPEVQKQSLTFTKDLSFEDFYPKFLKTHFTIKNLPPLFILEEGKPVGVIRFNRAPGIGGVEISIVLAKDARGKGLGKRAIEEATEWVKAQGFSAVIAKIKPENTPSIKAFKAAGFHEGGKVGELLVFVHPLNPPEPRKVFVIAEAGSNWTEADPFEMIFKARAAGADAIKFQVFRAETTYVKEAGVSNYLQEDVEALFKSKEMPYSLIPKLARACEVEGIEFMATPFSLADFHAIDPYVKRHKIASYENNYFALLRAVARTKKPLFVSTGATTLKETAWIVDTLHELGSGELTLMQCTAKYPAPPNSMHLSTIPALKETYGCPVGLSDHSLDPFAAPLGAVALGASAIEKHFTLDRTLKGPDHSFAIEPDELHTLVSQIRALEEMIGDGYKQVVDAEKELRDFARRGIQAIEPIKKGDILTEGGNIAVLRPGNCLRGMPPEYIEELEGKKAPRDFMSGEGIIL